MARHKLGQRRRRWRDGDHGRCVRVARLRREQRVAHPKVGLGIKVGLVVERGVVLVSRARALVVERDHDLERREAQLAPSRFGVRRVRLPLRQRARRRLTSVRPRPTVVVRLGRTGASPP